MTHCDVSITELLPRWRDGDADAEQQVIAVVYDELRKLASSYLEHERADHTLQPTALVHEAYLRLVLEKDPGVQNRAHLLGLLARLMRQILVNHAVARQTHKRGRGWKRVNEHCLMQRFEERSIDILALDDALARLADVDPVKARIVELRFFGGLTVEDVAAIENMPVRSVVRAWTVARAWLRKEVDLT